jgi:hypothetical protein
VGFFQPRVNNKTKDKRNMKTIDTFAPLACVAALLTQTCLGQNASAGRPPTTPGQVHPPVHFRWGTTEPAATLAPTGFSPAQIRQAYGFDQLPGSVDGTGQTIAIIDAFGDGHVTGTTTTGNGHHKTTTTTIADATGIDWTNFCHQFGLPTDGLTVAYPQGPTTSTNWSLETALDIEWAHAIAPGAKILPRSVTSMWVVRPWTRLASGTGLCARPHRKPRRNANQAQMAENRRGPVFG